MNESHEPFNILLPVHIYADYPAATSASSIDIYTWYAKNQGITDFTLEYSEDGINDWKEIAKVENHEWTTNSAEVENLHIGFEPISNAKSFRLKVCGANQYWNHFAINEIVIE